MKISSSKAPGEVHFVHHSALGEGPSAKSRRHAYSQAARNFHARARRQLTIEYQAAKAAQRKREEGEEKANRQRLRSSSDAPPPWAQDQGFSEGSGRRPNVPSPASLLASDRKDPFSSCARSFRPIEHLLLDHYIRVVIPNMGFHCNRNRGSICHMRPMMISFIQLAVGDASLLNGLFLSASRHLSQHHQDRQFFEQLATQFKVACVQNVSSDISARTSSVIREGTIANVLMLAWDEIALHDFATSWTHVQGATKMANIRRSSQSLSGMNVFLELMLERFVENVPLLQEAKVTHKYAGEGLDSLEPILHDHPGLVTFLPLKIELTNKGML